jgi:hypothetical protein
MRASPRKACSSLTAASQQRLLCVLIKCARPLLAACCALRSQLRALRPCRKHVLRTAAWGCCAREDGGGNGDCEQPVARRSRRVPPCRRCCWLLLAAAAAAECVMGDNDGADRSFQKKRSI